MKKIFILKWNPAFSSTTEEEWAFWKEKENFIYPNWSVHEHEKVDIGDEWFMLKVGDGPTGIVGYGLFSELPRRGGDWRGQGKIRYYAEMALIRLLDSNTPAITTQELQRDIPDFDWEGGHSGVLLSANDAEKLWNLWEWFEEKHPYEYDYRGISIERGTEKKVIGWEMLESILIGCEDKGEIYTENFFHDMVTLSTHHDYGKSEFTFTIVISCSTVIPVICRRLKSIKAKLRGDEYYGDYFRLWHDGKYFHINVNEVDVICEEIEFGKTSVYDKHFFNVTI